MVRHELGATRKGPCREAQAMAPGDGWVSPSLSETLFTGHPNSQSIPQPSLTQLPGILDRPGDVRGFYPGCT